MTDSDPGSRPTTADPRPRMAAAGAVATSAAAVLAVRHGQHTRGTDVTAAAGTPPAPASAPPSSVIASAGADSFSDDRRLVVQLLLRRAGFAPGHAEVDRALQMTTGELVDELLNRDRIPESPGAQLAAFVPYPQTSFGSGLQLLASVIASGQPLRVEHVTLGGFDTHAKEDPTHEQLMQTLAEGLAAFFQDLEVHGAADDVLVMTWSEFGRRVGESASGGTDHGTAVPLFVLGKPARGGIDGDAVSLTQLDDNRNLRFTTDFRSVYSTVIEGWLETDPTPVLGGSFPSLGFV